MSASRRLVIGIHNHQPVGNFDHVFAWAYDRSYEPILATLEAYPKVRVAFHHSGPLLEWIEANRPEYLDRLGEMVERGQVELMGGGFYEPILVVLSERDRQRQLERMNRFLEQRFGRRPDGVWLAERIWEPHMAGTLARAGIRYVALDDYHFARAGMDPNTLHGTYLTEDSEEPLAVFPIAQSLRYCIPFGSIEDVRQACLQAPIPDGGALGFFDDGEKFGVWPRTYKAVHEDGWLKNLFAMLSDPNSGVTTALPGEVLEEPPVCRVYLPSASYFEMSEWTLPPDRAKTFTRLAHEAEENGTIEELRPFLAGGFWRGFLTKYPESNLQHKLTARTSVQLAEAEMDDETRDVAEREVERAQCNCAYWHGVFGGIYLPHLRAALQQTRIRAAAAMWPAGRTPCWEIADVEVDGRPLVMVDTPSQSLGLKPGTGGALTVWDLRHPAHAFHDVFNRRAEGYHDLLVPADEAPEQGDGNIHNIVRVLPEGERLVYDWYRRLSLIDRFSRDLPTALDYRMNEVHELGDFVGLPYRSQVSGPADDGQVTVDLQRDGHLWWKDGSPQALRVHKTVRVDGAGPALQCAHTITNTGDYRIQAWWGVECNLKLASDEGDERRISLPHTGAGHTLDGYLDAVAAPTFELQDDGLGLAIRLQADGDVRWVSYGVHTLSQSEAGVDRIYQGTCVVALRRLDLEPGESLEAVVNLSVILDEDGA